MKPMRWCVDCRQWVAEGEFSESAADGDSGADCCLMCEKDRENFMLEMRYKHGLEEQHELGLEGHA